MARRILDIIADVLTLVALVVAAVGHVLLVGRVRALSMMPDQAHVQQHVQGVFLDHLLGSGIALGVLGLAVFLSVLSAWTPLLRRLLNLIMFAAGFTALMFQVPLIPWLAGIRQSLPGALRETPPWIRDLDEMILVALIPTCFAIFFSLVRMIWTMPPFRAGPVVDAQRGKSSEAHPHRPGVAEGIQTRPAPPRLPDRDAERAGGESTH